MTARRTPRGQRWTIPQRRRCPRVHQTLLWLHLLWVRGTWRGKYRWTLKSLVSIIFLWHGLQENHNVNNRLFARWRHITNTTSENPSGFCFFFVQIWAFVILSSLGYERTENEMNSGLSSKKTPSFKWPFPFSFSKICCQHRSSDPCTRNKVRELEVKRF